MYIIIDYLYTERKIELELVHFKFVKKFFVLVFFYYSSLYINIGKKREVPYALWRMKDIV